MMSIVCRDLDEVRKRGLDKEENTKDLKGEKLMKKANLGL